MSEQLNVLCLAAHAYRASTHPPRYLHMVTRLALGATPSAPRHLQSVILSLRIRLVMLSTHNRQMPAIKRVCCLLKLFAHSGTITSLLTSCISATSSPLTICSALR
ncbi:hypothetical protein TRVL_06193 [Trypanosoma vivax]|nr:hypothetical protein TRVL_06193 [Trypanosoma vivax]